MITLNFYHFIIHNHVMCEPNLNQKQGLHLVGPGFRDLNSGNINLKNLIATLLPFCSGLAVKTIKHSDVYRNKSLLMIA